jgi:hypothetical protein
MPTLTYGTLPSAGTTADANQVTTAFNAVATVVNGLDTANWATGKIFDPTKILQSGAAAVGAGTVHQVLAWDGTNWSPWTPTTSHADAYLTANQSLTSGTYTAIGLAGENYDTESIHDTATNNSRLTCKTAGRYFVEGTLTWAGSTAGSTRIGRIVSNGVTLQDEMFVAPPAAAVSVSNKVGRIVSLAVNDYVELFGMQDTGGALNVIAASFGMFRIAT